jgi:ubiquitin C-terminal hydrolase
MNKKVNNNNLIFNNNKNKNMKVNNINMKIILNNNININPNIMNNNMIFNINMMKICNNNILKSYNTFINDLVKKKFKIIIEKQKIFPLKGLNNVGLTCYMNSTLQCLLHVPELNIFFINYLIK